MKKRYIVTLHLDLHVEAEDEDEAIVMGAEHFQQRTYDCSDLSVNEDTSVQSSDAEGSK